LQDVVDVNTDAERGGPLVEYERRIAAGELMAGDKCQVFCTMISEWLWQRFTAPMYLFSKFHSNVKFSI